MNDIHLVAIVGAAATLVVIGDLLRRRQLHEKYAFFWIIVGANVALLALVPGILDWVADRLGVADPVNLLLFLATMLLLLVCLHLSWESSRLEDETRLLAEEVAILRQDVERLRGDGVSGAGDRPRLTKKAG